MMVPVNTKVKKVLLVVYRPVMSDGTTLDVKMSYDDPFSLVSDFCDVINKSSHNTYKYEVTEKLVVDQFAQLEGNIVYSEDLFNRIEEGRFPAYANGFDYHEFLRRFEITRRISLREIDEVWVMSHPYSNLLEAVMGGPKPYWLTGPSLKETEQSIRKFVIMGFEYSNDLGAMLEAFIHRAEACMYKAYGEHDGRNYWLEYIAVANPSTIAGVGTAHYAPNSTHDYDWRNSRYVQSTCKDWYNYPELTGAVTTVNHTEWGYGSRIDHHSWWLDHLPHQVGKTAGMYNNWWHYIMTPDWTENG